VPREVGQQCACLIGFNLDVPCQLLHHHEASARSMQHLLTHSLCEICRHHQTGPNADRQQLSRSKLAQVPCNFARAPAKVGETQWATQGHCIFEALHHLYVSWSSECEHPSVELFASVDRSNPWDVNRPWNEQGLLDGSPWQQTATWPELATEGSIGSSVDQYVPEEDKPAYSARNMFAIECRAIDSGFIDAPGVCRG
jgi:hypothetical protein